MAGTYFVTGASNIFSHFYVNFLYTMLLAEFHFGALQSYVMPTSLQKQVMKFMHSVTYLAYPHPTICPHLSNVCLF